MMVHEDEIEVATDRWPLLGYTVIASLHGIEVGHAAQFLNAGGGLLALAGADNSAVYYNMLPVPANAAVVTYPFKLTTTGLALGLLEGSGSGSDDNCCATHNSFQLPGPGSPYLVAETDGAGLAETLISGRAGPQGAIPWHPHTRVRLSDGLSASVDLSDGHVDVTASDLAMPGRGPDLTLDHTWDSTLAQAGVTSTAGQGWLTSLSPRMGGVLTQTVTYTDSSGAAWPFTFSGAVTAPPPYTTYHTPAGLPWALTTSTAGYTLANVLSGETLAFDAQGRYLADTDAYGNQNVLSYGASGPVSETNSGGRALSLAYTNGLLSDVQSPLWRSSGGAQGQHVTYGYNGSGQLTTLTRGAGTNDALTTAFGYSGTQLISITTPYQQATHTWTLGYDASSRLVSMTSPISGQLGQAGYTPAYTTTLSYSAGTTTVVDGAGSSAPLTTTYTLDTQGEPLTVADGLNHSASYQYDQDHDVTRVTDANQHTTTNYYQYVGPNGSTGLITQTVGPAIDSSGPVTTAYAYDANNNLVKTVSGAGGLTYYQYDAHHSVITATQQISPTWRGTVNLLDQYGEVTGTVNGRGVLVPPPAQGLTPTASLSPTATLYMDTWGYDAQGDITRTSTPPLTTTLNGSLRPNLAATTVYTPDADGNPITSTTPNGASSVNAFDHLGRLVQTTGPAVTLYTGSTQAPVQTIGYDGEGHVVRTTDGAGDLSRASYDPRGRLVATVNPLGATTLYTYSATELSAVRDAVGNVTRYGYDQAGRLSSTTDPLGTTTQTYGYDPVGNTIAITTPLDYAHPSAATVESRLYDALDEVISDTVRGSNEVTPTVPQTTLWSYDHDGNAAQQVLPDGTLAQNVFDLADRRTQVTVLPAPPAVQALTLDPADNLTQQVDFTERTHTRGFDGANRLLQQVDTCPSCASTTALTTTVGYDPDGNTLSLQRQSASYGATYNALDWLTSANDGAGTTTAYGYDAAGRVRSVIPPGGTLSLAASLDAAGRPLSLSDTLTDTVAATTTTSTSSFTYTADDLPLTDTLPAGITLGRQYDADNRLTQAANQAPNYALSFGYAYAPQGQITAVTTTPGIATPQVESYLHDALGRLSTDLPSDGTAALTYYDRTGNITATYQGPAIGPLLAATYAYTYGAIGAVTPTGWLPNELVALTNVGTSQTTTYGYDRNGDTTAITTTGSPTSTTSLSYDAAGRLSGVLQSTGSGTRGVQLAYNARGLRSSYTVTTTGQTLPLVQETLGYRGVQLGQVVVTGTATTPFTETFLYRPDGSPLELLVQSQDGQGHNQATARYWYLLDGQGSVVGLLNSQHVQVASYFYDAWGAPTHTDENWGVHQPLRYRGYWYDGWDDSLSAGTWNQGVLPWYWLTTRAYDPVLRRFLQPDPSSQDGVRSYVYAHDDPVDRADPSGLESGPDGEGDTGGGLGVGGGGRAGWAAAGAPAETPPLVLGTALDSAVSLGGEADGLTAAAPEATALAADAVAATDEAIAAAGEAASGPVDMTPGSPAHRQARWEEYQARGGTWSQEHWNNVYNANMNKPQIASEPQRALMQTLDWGEGTRLEATVQAEIEGQLYDRRLDVANERLRRGYEVKTGDQYATEGPRGNLWEIARDEALRAQRWDIRWYFVDGSHASRNLLQALRDANIPYEGRYNWSPEP